MIFGLVYNKNKDMLIFLLLFINSQEEEWREGK